MSLSNDGLEAQIRREIAEAGPVPFSRFMELSLYAPGLGYYEGSVRPIGRAGDYFTSVGVGLLFGELLGFRCCRWLDGLRPPGLDLVEAGAHEGQLAADILHYLRQVDPDFFSRLTYWIVEPSNVRRDHQRKRLEAFRPRVRWIHEWAEGPPEGWSGVIFCNELLDAFPVRRLGWDKAHQRWFEWGVTVRRNRFGWEPIRLDPPAARRALDGFFAIPPDLETVLPDGFTVEISPAACVWWQQAAARLARGRLLAVDYGGEAEDLLDPGRVDGTVRAYRHHTVTRAVLADPGEQDLTAHVNFTALREAGEAVGLTTESNEPQGQFLTGIVADIESNPGRFQPWTAARRRQLATLVHPEHLGRAFRVLVQERRPRPAAEPTSPS
jgi:SAM-dependent MidA family methyltransferase